MKRSEKRANPRFMVWIKRKTAGRVGDPPLKQAIFID
jgi:hypothetical protein